MGYAKYEERCGEKVDDRPGRHLPVQLGVEAGGPGDEAGDHQGQDHQLEQAHEELPRVGEQQDCRRWQEKRTKANPKACADQNPKEG